MNTLHIRAVGDLRCPYVDAAGRNVPGRFAGRARKTFDVLPEGESVPDHEHYRRALKHGDLALVAPAPLDVPTAIAPLPVIDLGDRLPVIDLPAHEENDQ
jgi:hypothetical protein